MPQFPSSSPSRASPLDLPLHPPPLPPKHERRLSIKSITASLRRSTSFSSNIDGESPFSHWSSQDDNRFSKSRRSSSLFSWKSNRSSIVVVEKSDEVEEKLKAYKFPSKANKSSRSTSRSRRPRNSSPPPPVPPLVIEIDSLPTLSNNHYKPLSPTLSRISTSSERASIPPSLPDFRKSTFQPLALDTLTSTVPSLPRLPTTVAKQLAARGPFPNRPLSTASSKSTNLTSRPRSRTVSVCSQRCPTPLPPTTPESSPSKLSSAPRLEPRSPRVHRRTRSTSSIPTSSSSLLRTPPSVSSLPPPPAPSSGSSSSSSMIRSPSFTLSLPTVAEVPPSPTPPPKRKLRPIVIAPRTPSTPSTPDLSHFSTANSSPSFSSFELNDKDAKSKAVVEPGRFEQKEKIDWEDLEKRLRNLSEDRLHILFAELERTK
ncbi:hypothetical protein JCM5350_005118 [Sporobolomyces pararoseus]